MDLARSAETPSPDALPCADGKLGNYLSGDVPDENKWADCVHCGLCLEACPTYLETGHEHQSPRGRVHLIKAVAEGKIGLNESFMDPVFTCLDCRACETACPSNVQVGGLIEEARGQVRRAHPLKGWKGWVSRFFLHGVFPHPGRLEMLGKGLRLLKRSGLSSFARRIGLMKLLPSQLEEMERVTPIPGLPVRKKLPEVVPARGKRKERVALLTGCVMDAVFGDVNEATVRVLTRNGYEVHIPRSQTCCGALHVHAGDREAGRELALRNMEAFSDADHVLVNAAGCGCAMQEYPELFREDPALRQKAEAFAEKVMDVSRFLTRYGFERPKGEIRARASYHDACHLAHGQGVREEPRWILRSIPGLEWVEMANADRCCGSAGIYNLTHPEMAGAVLRRKMEDVPEDAELIPMGNPGCMLQMSVGVLREGRRSKVVHTMELLDRSYRIGDREGKEASSCSDGKSGGWILSSGN
ncbi:glycolate oxidase iron-sulfur subunit [Melghirimyces profundicolus]|uniref:Glycolate oxidase iron-sulfur subunit n=1 Tax=Melghirimyces profundicolus TaxID=1242148 RepID=A0A2T6BW74_9BACL|nr:(Fe-S)-binding protein [Melghirimyces profundicolus]PTX60325.1 glycolate oxidase iron-sulfur subunit [Melghirimyces profundicolus]